MQPDQPTPEPTTSASAALQPPTAPPIPWVPLAWFAVLLGICYAPVIQKLVKDWIIDEDMGHAFFVPAVAGYVIWQRRAEVLAKSYTPNYLGLGVVMLGGLMLLAGTLGAELFVTRVAFLVAIYGAIFTLGGVGLFRELLFPLSLLVFMVPLPAIIYNQITFPLQLLASGVAERVLGLVGIPVLRDGNVLELPSQRLQVVEACSGIRSLLSLTFLSLVYAYFFDSKSWMRIALLLCVVPLAIAANAARVTLTGIFSEANPEFATGIYHSLEGWVMFMLSLSLLVGTHQVINRVYGALRPKP